MRKSFLNWFAEKWSSQPRKESVTLTEEDRVIPTVVKAKLVTQGVKEETEGEKKLIFVEDLDGLIIAIEGNEIVMKTGFVPLRPDNNVTDSKDIQVPYDIVKEALHIVKAREKLRLLEGAIREILN